MRRRTSPLIAARTCSKLTKKAVTKRRLGEIGGRVRAEERADTSHYLRGDCRRRLRLDPYGSEQARDAARAPRGMLSRPGLALLVEQGRRFEREKFGELRQSFAGRVTHGAVTERRPGEERTFARINLDERLEGCGPDHFLIEADPVTPPCAGARAPSRGRYRLPAGRGASLRFGAVRPDILQVMPAGRAARVDHPVRRNSGDRAGRSEARPAHRRH